MSVEKRRRGGRKERGNNPMFLGERGEEVGRCDYLSPYIRMKGGGEYLLSPIERGGI